MVILNLVIFWLITISLYVLLFTSVWHGFELTIRIGKKKFDLEIYPAKRFFKKVK